ncbi:MAG: TerC family protein [Thermoanaerobaculia bacterium]|nr:TerC family protein [Thermoanaerobaculia bacterium]
MESIGTPLLWSVFAVVVTVSLALDLFVFHREAHEVDFKEGVIYTLLWIAVSLAFNVWIWLDAGSGPALEFLTGYVIEKSLSVDNIFVFLVIFDYFSVPSKYQHRVLFWGILGAVVMRGLFVLLGVALIHRFEWVMFVFGGFLVFTGIRLFFREDAEMDPEHNPVVHWLEKHVPVTKRYDGQSFWTRVDGRIRATPLLLVLLVVELTDVVFAVDSIPAIFGVTRDPFLVFTSNIFAILGLRALYFVLRGLVDRLEYLHYGLGGVLTFIGVKMLVERWVHVPVEWSLAVVVALLTVAAAASWFRDPEASPPERL